MFSPLSGISIVSCVQKATGSHTFMIPSIVGLRYPTLPFKQQQNIAWFHFFPFITVLEKKVEQLKIAAAKLPVNEKKKKIRSVFCDLRFFICDILTSTGCHF
jgi:hypothetical protein